MRGEAAGRDTIALRGIRAWGHHGANPGEQDVIGPIEVELVIEFDAGAARASDELRDTIDYAALHATVLGIVARTRCRLLERLGELILEAAMSDSRVVAARVALAKPGLLAGSTPVVTVGRTRPT